MPDWSADQYAEFERERTLPAINLADAIPPGKYEKIIDIGCGPGNSSAALRRKFPNAEIVGVDNSESMLAKARKTFPDLKFIKADVSDGLGTINERFDIAFSNACIQWIPNHSSLLIKMMDLLNVGGVLAVQIPLQAKHPMHSIIPSVAGNGKWRDIFKAQRSYNNLTAEEYYDVLSDISSDFSIWETVYMHRMPSHKSIVEWYKGTGLRPYLDVLDDKLAAEFENDILKEVASHYPIRKNGEILFEFPRLFFTAVK